MCMYVHTYVSLGRIHVLCGILCLTLPSCEHLQDTRQVEFFSCREAILKLWSSLDQTAIGGFEETVRDGDTNRFVLSEDNMDSLHQLKAKVQYPHRLMWAHTSSFSPSLQCCTAL